MVYMFYRMLFAGMFNKSWCKIYVSEKLIARFLFES